MARRRIFRGLLGARRAWALEAFLRRVLRVVTKLALGPIFVLGFPQRPAPVGLKQRWDLWFCRTPNSVVWDLPPWLVAGCLGMIQTGHLNIS